MRQLKKLHESPEQNAYVSRADAYVK